MPTLKRILVTGGAGFLGSHLCQRLVEEGHDVICLDNFFTSQKTNVAHLLDQPNFELVRHDVIQPIWLEVDEIYNLACPAAPGHYQFNPIKTMKTSIVGAINVLGMAKRCRAKVLQTSTSEVYGDPEVHPQPESRIAARSIRSGRGPATTKASGRPKTLFMDYHRMNRVNIRIVRIFNTYGPRMHPFDGRVVSNFIRQAISGEDITIFGDGSQTRSFCYRDDLVDGLIRLMNAPGRLASARSIWEIPTSSRCCELADLVLELTGSKSKLVAPSAAARRSDQAPARHHASTQATGLAADRAAARGAEKDDRLVWHDQHEPLPRADAELLTIGQDVLALAKPREGGRRVC